MKLRQRAWAAVLLTTIATVAVCASNGAWLTALTLICATLIAMRLAHKPVAPLQNLKDWLIALEGKDPFNPDAKPNYEWRGFVTTFFAALRVNNHPTLAGAELFVFRDEIDADDWRKLVTRIRHGAHTHVTLTPKEPFLQRFFE
jgi:hypothetical protein